MAFCRLRGPCIGLCQTKVNKSSKQHCLVDMFVSDNVKDVERGFLKPIPAIY